MSSDSLAIENGIPPGTLLGNSLFKIYRFYSLKTKVNVIGIADKYGNILPSKYLAGFQTRNRNILLHY